MASLRRILLYMLVLSTLGYSSAWAYDGHAVEQGDESLVTVDTTSLSVIENLSNHDLEQSSEHASDADVACDHCCHISAHLQAIFTQNGFICSVNRSSELLEFSETSILFIVSPDIKPPRV